VLGLLIVLAGFVLLGNVVLANRGVRPLPRLDDVDLRDRPRRRGTRPHSGGGFWSAALGGALLVVLGLFMLRNPLIGALSLTLMAGALFFASGLTRVIMAFQGTTSRWLLVFSGLISIGLGLWVLLNIATATLTLLGTLVGIQTLLEGLTMIMVGRLRPEKKG
jgi:uncharacterized membrane protein HdeD (DUF308 family)